MKNPLKNYRIIKIHLFSNCARCNRPLYRGAEAFYFPATLKVFCVNCGECSFNDFLLAASKEDYQSPVYR